MRDDGRHHIELVFRAAPFGAASLAGQQIKTTAHEVPLLRCDRCNLEAHGRIEDGAAVFTAADIEGGFIG